MKKDIDKEITQRCKELGFKKRQYNFYKPLTNSSMATLGFGCASFRQRGHFFFNVTVGVFNKDIDELYSKLTGYSGAKYMQPTIGKQLGYLMPENDFYEWDIVDDADNAEKFDSMFSNIQKYGYPYQEKMSNFDNLFEAFYNRDSGILNEGREKTLPILYYMKGEKEKGIKFIQETIERRSKRPNRWNLFGGRDKEKKIILRAGEDSKLTTNDMEKMLNSLPSGGSIEIVGSGCNGNIDPSYLEFAKRYEQLP